MDPVSASKRLSVGNALLFKQKAVTYMTEDIAACTLLEEKPSGKRLIFQATISDWKIDLLLNLIRCQDIL